MKELQQPIRQLRRTQVEGKVIYFPPKRTYCYTSEELKSRLLSQIQNDRTSIRKAAKQLNLKYATAKAIVSSTRLSQKTEESSLEFSQGKTKTAQYRDLDKTTLKKAQVRVQIDISGRTVSEYIFRYFSKA